jgi:hypothetical protein
MDTRNTPKETHNAFKAKINSTFFPEKPCCQEVTQIMS